MKKLITTAVFIAAIAATAVADRTYSELCAQANSATNAAEQAAFAESITENEAKAVLDSILDIASTNVKTAVWRFNYHVFPSFSHSVKWATFYRYPNLMPEYDAKLAAAGIGTPLIYYKDLPLMAEFQIASNPETSSKIPVAIAATRLHKTFGKNAWTLAEMLNGYAEFASVGFGAYAPSKSIKKTLLESAPRTVKRTLRLRGKSFVVKPGEENPVQPPIDALSAALNAPKLAGLKEWVAEWCPSYDWVEPNWMTQSEADALKEAVFFGEAALDAKNETLLLGYYGVDEYNKFIAEYNGDDKTTEE